MEYLSSASEWLQRHAVHLLLRHGLSHVFANQLDLDQLQVQLRRHAVRKCMTWHGQLLDIEISKDFLNQHAIPVGLEIDRAVVGTAEVAISFAGPSLTLRLSDLHIHAKPHQPTEEEDDAQPQDAFGGPEHIGSEPPEAISTFTTTSTLLDRLKPMAAAVERMLNTVSCCVDRLHFHLHLPAPETYEPPSADRQQLHTPTQCDTTPTTEVPATDPAEPSHTLHGWCVVLSVGSLKLVDTSDCFMSPPGIISDASATLDPGRPVEVSKSLFWDDLRVTIVRDDESSEERSPAAALAPASGGAPSQLEGEGGRGVPLQRHSQLSPQDRAGCSGSPQECGARLGVGRDPPSGVQSPDDGPHTAAAGPGGAPVWRTSGSDAAGESARLQPGGSSGVLGGHDPSDSEDFRDAEEAEDDEMQDQGYGEVVLFTGAGGCGWRGKATLQLAWEAVAEGGALRNARVTVESSEGAVVGLAAEHLASLAEAAAAALDAAEWRNHARARAAAGPPIALADVTASMLGALRPGLGMQDVLAMAAEGGDLGEGRGEVAVSCMTEMHDARSMLASSMMLKAEAPRAPTSPSWHLRVDLQPPEAEGSAVGAVPAIAFSIWDTAPQDWDGAALPVFGVMAEVGSITVSTQLSDDMPLKASSRIQGLQVLTCLSSELHEQHGGDTERQAAARIPALLHVAPPAPAAAPCATMETPASPPIPPSFRLTPEHLHGLLPSAAGAMHAWPIAAPALPAHRTCRCQVATGKAHADEVSLRLPPYAVTIPTATMRLVAQLAGRLAVATDTLAACGPGGARADESQSGADVWGSMVPGASVPSPQQRRPLHILVTLPRLFCALLAEPAVAPARSVWSGMSTPRPAPRAHLVLDLRCYPPPGCAANDPPPLLKVVLDPHCSRPLQVDAAASTISLLLISCDHHGGMHAHCIAGLAAPQRGAGGPADASTFHGYQVSSAALRLFISVKSSAQARCGVIGDPVARAWMQANAHCRCDWQLNTDPTQHHAASLASTYAPPSAGVLFPVAFSTAEVEEAAHAGSTAVITLRAPHVSAYVSEEQLAGLMVLLGTVMARARVPAADDAPPVATATHIAVNVVTAVRVSIERADGRTDIDAGRVACVLGQGIGGVAGAMVMHLTATGLRIIQRSPDDDAPAALIFHIPPPSAAEGAMPRLEIVSASQPLERQPSAGALRTRTLTSHHMKRATFGTLAGDLTLSWLNRLADLFQLPAPSMPAPVAVSESSTHLSLEDCALGYMPPSTAAAAAPRSLHAAAFVAFARGLHTYTVGSARHVDLTAVNVAVGRVRSGGLAPWACAPPPAGWTLQSCAALGLDLIASEDAASVVLDTAAPVDSDAVDVPPATAAPAADGANPAQCLTAFEYPALGTAGEPGTADPLLAHVQRRRAAQEWSGRAAAPRERLAITAGPPPRAPGVRRPCPHVLRQPAATPTALPEPSRELVQDSCTTEAPLEAQPSHSGSDEGANVFAGSPGDSDVEVLSGRDACMMAVVRLQLRRLSITLTPDSCALVQSLSEQLAASVAATGADTGSVAICAADSVAGAGNSVISEAGANDWGSVADSHAYGGATGGLALDVAATVGAHNGASAVKQDTVSARGGGSVAVGSSRNPPSTGAPAWPDDLSERKFERGSSVQSTRDAPATNSEHLDGAKALHDPACMLAGSCGGGHSGAWSDLSSGSRASSAEPAVQDVAMSHMFEEGPSSTDGHSVGISDSPFAVSPASRRSSPGELAAAPAQALDQTLFLDASSTLLASTAMSLRDPGATLESGGSPPPSVARTVQETGAALLPQHASPENIMHDMMLAGGSVIAVGTCEGDHRRGQGLSSVGIPTEQEADGVLIPELQGSANGLLSAVMWQYVGAKEPPPPPRLQEPVVGRLGGQYPDSCRRVSVAAQSVTVLLRPDGVPTADLAAAVRMRGGGLVRLEVSAIRLQHDTFPAGVLSHMRLAAAARAITAQQAGFGARVRPLARRSSGGVQWRPLATELQHGPSDPRRDVLRVLLRVADTEQGKREAFAWLRLPSLRLRLEQPCLLFLRDINTGIKRQQEANRAAAQTAGTPEPDSPSSLSSLRADAVPRGDDGGASRSGPEALAASTDSCTLLVSFDEPPAAAATLHNVLFRTVEIASFVLAVDYIPSTADYAALREGSLFELVNLVNWNNVRVEFKAASLQRVHGAEALLRLLAGRWLADIRSNQAVRVLEGATPVASFVRLGTAVHRLASHAATMPIATQRLSRPAREETVVARRQLHRNARYLLHTLTLEALGLGAWVAGGTAGLLGMSVASPGALEEVGERGNVFMESADLIRKEVGAALFALLSRPANAVQQGQGLHGAAWAAATAVPQAIRRPLGATAAAVQKTCIGMQQAVEYTLPPPT